MNKSILGAWVLLMILGYLLGSFVGSDLNCFNWHWLIRLCYVAWFIAITAYCLQEADND